MLFRGLVNAYGSFGTYYELGPLHGYPASTIAWIGSIQAYLMLFTGALTGPLFDAGHFRLLLIVGSSLIVLGMATTSVSTKLWQIMLSQAFAVGIGQGCLFSPSLAVLSTYFSEKRFFIAMGLAAAGSGLGKSHDFLQSKKQLLTISKAAPSIPSSSTHLNQN